VITVKDIRPVARYYLNLKGSSEIRKNYNALKVC
jgi:hypothetical protein